MKSQIAILRALACLACLICLGIASISPAASAADLCAPLDNLRKRDLSEATGLYRSCRDANMLYDRANSDLGIRAMFSAAEAEAYVGRGVDPTVEKKALGWNQSVSDFVRQNAAGKELLERALGKAVTAEESEPGDPRRQARLEAALQALAKVSAKGENLKRFLLLHTQKIRSTHQLKQALRAFYDEEPLVFRAPASIE